jgi:hypothetical protein
MQVWIHSLDPRPQTLNLKPWMQVWIHSLQPHLVHFSPPLQEQQSSGLNPKPKTLNPKP